MKIREFLKYVTKHPALISTTQGVTELAYFCAERHETFPLESLIHHLEGILDTQFLSVKYSERKNASFTPKEISLGNLYTKLHKRYLQFLRRELNKKSSLNCSHVPHPPKKKRRQNNYTKSSVGSYAHDKRVTQINSSATCFVNGMLVTAQSYSDIYNELNNR